MTNPTTSIAWPLAQQVATLVGAHANCTTIDVTPFPPGGKAVRPEFMYVASIKVPTVQVAGWQSGRKQRNETVTMTLEGWVTGKRTADALMDRLMALVGAVEDVFAADPSIATDGVIFGEVTGYDLDPFELAEGGFGGSCRTYISIQTRLH
jgi:hypothetical protein